MLVSKFLIAAFALLNINFTETHVLNTAVAQGIGFNQMYGAVRDVYSAELWFTALPVMKFDEFTTKKTELGVQKGMLINMPKMGGLKRGGELKEGVHMVAQSMSTSSQDIRVRELGNAIAFSEFLLNVAFFDQLAAASILLGRDLAIVLDLTLRDTFLSSSNVIYAGSKSARTDLLVGDKFSTKEIKDGVEQLETNSTPRWGGQWWIWFIHPHQGRSVRDDPNWINASLYGATMQIFTGEIGMYEDARFIVSTILPNGAKPAVDPDTNQYIDMGYSPLLKSGYAGNQTTIYQAVAFGEYAVGHAVALPVELRDNGTVDYSREHGIAWYSIWGEATLEEDNIIVVETA